MRTPPTVVTIGVFDGFHRGHARVVERARERAGDTGSRLVVFTFDRHPRTVVSPDSVPAELASRAATVHMLREAGAEEIRVVRFTTQVAKKSPREFFVDHVFPFARMGALVVGHDFAMGQGRSGRSEVLQHLGEELGFATEFVDAVREAGTAVSSSRIRDLLAAGNVEEAERCLGRPYRISGPVETGDGRGRTLGYPTANLAIPPRRMRPAPGVYVVRAAGTEVRGPGVANVGTRPTFAGVEERVEVHLFGGGDDLVGRVLRVEFLARLRGELKFKNSNDLKNQIAADIETAKALLPTLEVADKSP